MEGRAPAARHPGDRGVRRARRGRELRGHRAVRPVQGGVAQGLPRPAERHPLARHLPARLHPDRSRRVRALVPRLGSSGISAGGGRAAAGGDRRQDRPGLVRPQEGPLALHLVSAYATERGLVLAQRAAETKGGELAVIPELLDGLDLRGCLVSLDALACQPAIAERIVGRGGDYLLALTGNRKKAHAEVKAWFAANAFALGASLRPFFDAFDDGHGRLVRRRVFACPDVTVFTALKGWPGLRAVLAVETIRGIPGRGKVTAEIRHYLSSAALPPEALAAAIRNHWRVENGLHWVLDVVFREDVSRVRER